MRSIFCAAHTGKRSATKRIEFYGDGIDQGTKMLLSSHKTEHQRQSYLDGMTSLKANAAFKIADSIHDARKNESDTNAAATIRELPPNLQMPQFLDVPTTINDNAANQYQPNMNRNKYQPNMNQYQYQFNVNQCGYNNNNGRNNNNGYNGYGGYKQNMNASYNGYGRNNNMVMEIIWLDATVVAMAIMFLIMHYKRI